MLRPTKRSQGFSLLETVFSTALVSLLLVVGMSTMSNVMRVRSADTHDLKAAQLASAFISEAMAKPFVSPVLGGTSFGIDSDETGKPRIEWDDFDDYHGLNLAVLQDAEGYTLPDCTGWSVVGSVAYADPSDPTIAHGGPTDLKKLTLNFTDPSGRLHSFEAFKSRLGLLQDGQSTNLLSNMETTVSFNGKNWITGTRINNQQAMP